jgi:DNA polymerase-3 subunit delta'
VLEIARSVYADPEFEPGEGARAVHDGARERAAEAKAQAEQEVDGLELPTREAEQRVRRAQRGAEWDELLLALEELAAWYRDLVVVAAGAETAVVHRDRLAELKDDGTRERMAGAERAAEIVRETWRSFEEFNVAPVLALEALFVQLRRELAGAGAPV